MVEPFKLVAVLDGPKGNADVLLCVERAGDMVAELPWPDDWPEWVSTDFLKQHGFEVTVA